MPTPPGSVRKASAASNIARLRAGMSSTTRRSVSPSCADLAVDELSGDHAGDPSAAAQHAVGHEPHEADVAAAVDEIDAPGGQVLSDQRAAAA